VCLVGQMEGQRHYTISGHERFGDFDSNFVSVVNGSLCLLQLVTGAQVLQDTINSSLHWSDLAQS
jgi:hypothetical protein